MRSIRVIFHVDLGKKKTGIMHCCEHARHKNVLYAMFGNTTTCAHPLPTLNVYAYAAHEYRRHCETETKEEGTELTVTDREPSLRSSSSNRSFFHSGGGGNESESDVNDGV